MGKGGQNDEEWIKWIIIENKFGINDRMNN